MKIITKFLLAITAGIAFGLSSLICKFVYKEFSIGTAINKLLNGENKEAITFFILFLISFLIVMFGLHYAAKRLKLYKEKENLGSSSFAKTEEFNDFTGDDGLMIGKKFRLSEKKSFEHVVIVGPTGSGKSASFFIPNLLNLPHASIVVSDPKGELFEKTAATNLAQGKRVLVFSPFRKNSMKYNPLALCRNVSEVREMAQVLLANGNASIEALTGTKGGGSEWTNMATPLLVAFMLYVKDLKPPKNTVSYALNLIVENDMDTLKYLMSDADDSAKKQFNVFMQSAESEKTASSIKTVLATNLQIFMDPMVEEVTSDNEINPMWLRESPCVLYCICPENKSATMAPLMAPFYSQIMSQLAETSKGCPVFILLDEFANIGKLGQISTLLSTVRSRKMSISLGIQSLNQIKQNYGNEEALSIMDNLKIKVSLPGLSYDSANVFSQLIGFKEISTTSTSFGKDTISHSTSSQKRELMTADEIRRIPDEQLVAVIDNRNPIMLQQIRYYKDEKMLKQTKNELDLDEYVIELREKADEEKAKKKNREDQLARPLKNNDFELE
jgi:type IV secretion system protein VirD4